MFLFEKMYLFGIQIEDRRYTSFSLEKEDTHQKEDTHRKERYSPKLKYLFDILVKFLYPPRASIVTHVALTN